jgi:hypothetical protein
MLRKKGNYKVTITFTNGEKEKMRVDRLAGMRVLFTDKALNRNTEFFQAEITPISKKVKPAFRMEKFYLDKEGVYYYYYQGKKVYF